MGTILIVEDDEQNHILMASLLQSMGHNVLHARTGQEGLELADMHRPDLILLDLRLPVRNGWDVASILKNDSELGNIPIVAVSVQVDPSDVERAWAAGCDEYIEKPFKLKLMRDCITHFVG